MKAPLIVINFPSSGRLSYLGPMCTWTDFLVSYLFQKKLLFFICKKKRELFTVGKEGLSPPSFKLQSLSLPTCRGRRLAVFLFKIFSSIFLLASCSTGVWKVESPKPSILVIFLIFIFIVFIFIFILFNLYLYC